MSLHQSVLHQAELVALEIRVRGRVQGVGFRPRVWRIAHDLDLSGEVLNDADGVLVRVGGSEKSVAAFIDRMEREPPPLGRIDHIETQSFYGDLPRQFSIAESVSGASHTQVTPDAAICVACVEETANPFARRFRYPFTNCTHCGPRLSIVKSIPFDRAKTTMAPFAMCETCGVEYRDPADRRFHAEAIACHNCGPKATLLRLDGGLANFGQHSMRDSVDALRKLIQMGEIVAIKGTRRLSVHLRCHECGYGRATAPVEATRCEALRADGARSRYHPGLLFCGRRGTTSAHRLVGSDRPA